jgi:DNA-directed RNA polymerase sigma subunit (sigma70/sigma32)
MENKKDLEKKIRKLASQIQLEINSKEMPVYLESLTKLEKILIAFRKIKLPKKTKTLVRIKNGFLTIKDLKKLEEKFSNSRSTRFSSFVTYKP